MHLMAVLNRLSFTPRGSKELGQFYVPISESGGSCALHPPPARCTPDCQLSLPFSSLANACIAVIRPQAIYPRYKRPRHPSHCINHHNPNTVWGHMLIEGGECAVANALTMSRDLVSAKLSRQGNGNTDKMPPPPKTPITHIKFSSKFLSSCTGPDCGMTFRQEYGERICPSQHLDRT